MTERSRRLRVVAVGLAFAFAGVLLVATGLDGVVVVAGTPVASTVLAGVVFAAAFGVAAALSLQSGERRRGVGDLVAVLGWLCLLVASVTGLDLLVGVGVVLLLGAGVYLVAVGLGVRPAAPSPS